MLVGQYLNTPENFSVVCMRKAVVGSCLNKLEMALTNKERMMYIDRWPNLQKKKIIG